MHGRLRQERAQLLNLTPASHTTKNRGQVHRVLLLRPFAGDCIIITEPSILPHLPCLDGKFVGDVLPPRGLSSKAGAGIRRRFFRQEHSPPSQYCASLGHTGLQVHGTYVLAHRAAPLLRSKTAGNILATFPGTGIDQPPLYIATMVQPPAQIGCSSRVETAQPAQIARPAHQLVATPEWETPLGRGPTDLPVVGNHVVAAVLTPTAQVRVRR